MQIKLGEQMRELRRRNGITQEDLARALGVTAQAVSRWEKGVCYPDMELVPSLANYFGVSIDGLFGYQGEREKRIAQICASADEMLNAQGDMTECVALLREALAEFPDETEFIVRLGYALYYMGWHKYGAQSYTEDGCDYVRENTEYQSNNQYWREAILHLEHALDKGLKPDDRLAAIPILVTLHKKLGQNDKAVAIAKRQDLLTISREVLLASAEDGEKEAKYHAEAILALMETLTQMVETATSIIIPMWGGDSTGLLLATANLYECIFSYGDCGWHHTQIRDLYFKAAHHEAMRGDVNKAMEYFDKCFEHHQKLKAAAGHGLREYSAPLLSNLTYDSDSLYIGNDYWRVWMDIYTPKLQDAVRANPKYAECFAE